MIVPNGQIDQYVISHMAIKRVFDNMVQLAILFFQPSDKHVTRMTHAQTTAQFVRTGLTGMNGVFAVPFVDRVAEPVLSHVVSRDLIVLVTPIVKLANTGILCSQVCTVHHIVVNAPHRSMILCLDCQWSK